MRDETIKACRHNEEIADSIYSGGMDAAWSSIEETVDALKRCQSISGTDDKQHNLLLMLTNINSDITSALMATRQGFSYSAGVTLRNIIESLACVVTFFRDDASYKKFLAGTYDKPTAITSAKTYYEGFGKLYGLLSNNFTHEPVEMLARGIRKFDGSFAWAWVPPVNDNPIPILTNLVCICMSSHIAGEITEHVFAEHLQQFIFWKKTEKQLVSKNPPSQAKVALLHQEFESHLKSRKAGN